MPKYLVAVGGSGQHMALAVTRMMRLEALPRDIKCLVLDSDDRHALSQKLVRPWEGVPEAEDHPLGILKIHPPFNRTAVSDAKFQDIFVDASHPQERDLFELMFDKLEADISVGTGMYGTPCVGAAVFSNGADNEMVKSLLANLRDAEAIYFAGSVVGGTGAGVMHKLISTVRQQYTGKAYGIFFLPWFQVPEVATEGAVSPLTLKRNLHHGLSYLYDHTVNELTCSVFIGHASTQTEVDKDVTLNTGDMSEHAHYVHLAAAHSLLTIDEKYTANHTVKVYGYAHKESAEQWLLDQVWADGKTLRHRVWAAKICSALLDHLLENGDTIKKTVKGGFGGFLANPDSITKELYGSIVKNAKPLNISNFDYAAAVLGEFSRRRESLGFCLEWLGKIYPPEYLKSDHKLMQDLAKRDAAGNWKILRDWWVEPVTPESGNSIAAKDVARILYDRIHDKALAAISGPNVR